MSLVPRHEATRDFMSLRSEVSTGLLQGGGWSFGKNETRRLVAQLHKNKGGDGQKQRGTNAMFSSRMLSTSSRALRYARMMTVGCVFCSRNSAATASTSPAAGEGGGRVERQR